MKTITRNTRVFSVSLPENAVRKLERTRKTRGQSRSAFIAALIEQEAQRRDWGELREYGNQKARGVDVTSEEDVVRIIHEYRKEKQAEI